MNDCWGGCGDNDEAASVSTVGPGSTRCARASVTTSAVMGPPSSSTTMTRHVLVLRPGWASSSLECRGVTKTCGRRFLMTTDTDDNHGGQPGGGC